MDIFGNTDPRKMSKHFFWDALGVDYSTAIRADISKQDYTVAPRYWYVDARFRCAGCKDEFVWSADEQKEWFETYCFYVDSLPTRCRGCRAKRRDMMQLRRDYDALVGAARSGGSADQKRSIIEIVDELESSCHAVPERMRETRDLFLRQLSTE